MPAPSTASRPASARAVPGALDHPDAFVRRHVGPGEAEQKAMLEALGLQSLAALVEKTVPKGIRATNPLALDGPRGEHEALTELRAIASQNRVFRSYLGQGYHDTLTPPVIQRNILENPGWYTAYTPYQAEISQGRLEAMLNFQTMVCDLAGMQIANASMLDEATAAAEAMHLCFAVSQNPKAKTFVVASDCHPQTIEVVKTRAKPLGIRVVVADPADLQVPAGAAGVLVQYPATDGTIRDFRTLAEKAHAAGALVVAASDPLALVLLTPPGEWGADVVVGSTQRFGVPMGYGGPHAGYLATKDEYKRQMPGRLVGVSKDVAGRHGLRLALGTREQHIRRERATSNICTAQVLLAVVASMYAVYHGPDGLRAIATRVRTLTEALRRGLARLGFEVPRGPVFDTLRVETGADGRRAALRAAAKAGINLRTLSPTSVGISLDEATGADDVADLLACFHAGTAPGFGVEDLLAEGEVPPLPAPFARTSEFLTHPVFHEHRSETELLRYMHRLQAKDLSLTTSMIPLGSCTMKLNATVEMFPVTWPEFGRMHPFAPVAQAKGYGKVFSDLERWLAEITGFAAVSLQPNAGSQGEYAGLLVIRAWHKSRGHGERDVCLIPQSAHGTNPASAVMAGMRVVVVACDAKGNVDVADLRAKAAEHAERLAALMITYPSTHGVFEESIREICDVVHAAGGQVYMDGANMNAQVGLCRPGDFGPDVCHLNIHKTFCLAEGTPVTLADGTTRAIEDLRVGEQVLAWSPSENGVRAKTLVGSYRTGRKPCVEVTLEDGRTITCTPDHRVLTTDGWIEAGRLEFGAHRIVVEAATESGAGETFETAGSATDVCLSARGGGAPGAAVLCAPRRSASVRPTTHLGLLSVRPVGERDVYDLTVADLHSFLANGVVVHNCIPHGGGGPGMGPIGVAEHLAPFLPGHPAVKVGGEKRIGPVSAAPWGSPSILVIPWVYIRCMGGSGLTRATEVAILNANYMAKRLEAHYPVLYRGVHGTVAHEFILDLRKLKEESGVEAIDVAKRLMDYGFHAPTVSFPVAGTLMVEPTESESKAELDRFCDALIAIRGEIQAVIDGKLPRDDNPLKVAPHTAEAVTASEWTHPYPRETAAYPAPWTHAHKYWPAVGRIDDVWGDRNLMCSCPPPDAYSA